MSNVSADIRNLISSQGLAMSFCRAKRKIQNQLILHADCLLQVVGNCSSYGHECTSDGKEISLVLILTGFYFFKQCDIKLQIVHFPFV